MTHTFNCVHTLKNDFSFQKDALVQLGMCQNVNITINKIMAELMTFKAGVEFTVEGRSGKKPCFKVLKLTKVVHRKYLLALS